MIKLTGQKLGIRAQNNWKRLQENVEAGAPALIIFDLTLIFLKDYLEMRGWKIMGKENNLPVHIFQPDFQDIKLDIEAIETFNQR